MLSYTRIFFEQISVIALIYILFYKFNNSENYDCGTDDDLYTSILEKYFFYTINAYCLSVKRITQSLLPSVQSAGAYEKKHHHRRGSHHYRHRLRDDRNHHCRAWSDAPPGISTHSSGYRPSIINGPPPASSHSIRHRPMGRSLSCTPRHDSEAGNDGYRHPEK